MTVNTKFTNIEPYLREFQTDFAHMNQITTTATEQAVEAQDLLRKYIVQSDDTLASVKAKYTTEISDKDRTIKWMAISLLLVSGCIIALGVKILTTKCPTG